VLVVSLRRPIGWRNSELALGQTQLTFLFFHGRVHHDAAVTPFLYTRGSTTIETNILVTHQYRDSNLNPEM
jgi:hypothetical protein